MEMKEQNVLVMSKAVTPTGLGGWQGESEKRGPRTQPKRKEGVRKSTGLLNRHSEVHKSVSQSTGLQQRTGRIQW